MRNVGATYKTEYILTIDTAKELSMVQNNEKGLQARKYFILVEKKFKEIVRHESITECLILECGISFKEVNKALDFYLSTVVVCYNTYCMEYKFKNLAHILVECNYSLDILNRNIQQGCVDLAIKNRIIGCILN